MVFKEEESKTLHREEDTGRGRGEERGDMERLEAGDIEKGCEEDRKGEWRGNTKRKR
jgi:hypothetical protein